MQYNILTWALENNFEVLFFKIVNLHSPIYSAKFYYSNGEVCNVKYVSAETLDTLCCKINNSKEHLLQELKG